MRFGPSPLAWLAITALFVAGCVDAESADAASQSPAAVAPTASASADLGSIEGLVTDSEQQPLPGVEVAILQSELQAKTDAQGRFVFNELLAGNYKLVAQRLGYESASRSIDVLAGEIASLTLALNPIEVLDEGYFMMKQYDGFMQCSMSAFSPVNPCGGVTGEDKTSWIVDVERPAPLKEAIIELMWTQTSAVTGDEMEIEFCDDIENRNVLCVQNQVGGYYRYADGKSPVVLRVSDVPKDAKQLLLGAGAKFGAKPVVQQKFTEFMTWCYVTECSDEYTAMPPAS